jgi:hypothetical protein
VIAPFLCSSQRNALADAIEQCRAGIDAELPVFAVDAKRDRHSAVNGWANGLGRCCLR